MINDSENNNKDKNFPKNVKDAAKKVGMKLMPGMTREPLKEGDPGFLSGELSEERKKSDQEHIAYMRQRDPSYPFQVSQQECNLCNKILKDATAELVGKFKLVIKDKKTGENRSVLVGPVIERCEYCGRNVRISKQGIEFQ